MLLLFPQQSTNLSWNITQLGLLYWSETLRFGRSLVPLFTRSIMIQPSMTHFQLKQRSLEIHLESLSNAVLLSALHVRQFMVKL
jgi:hypothetical protein